MCRIYKKGVRAIEQFGTQRVLFIEFVCTLTSFSVRNMKFEQI
jgi:hypothetical protein